MPIERKAVQFVEKAAGKGTIDHFLEDWTPIGGQLWREIYEAGLAFVDAAGRLQLTEAGITYLAQPDHAR